MVRECRVGAAKVTDDAEKDYRYTLGDIELEGYQITPLTRFQEQLWPDWLKMKRLDDELNRVFTISDKPSVLWLSLPTGDAELPELAWIVKYADGHYGIVDALDFEEYSKVVPNPPPVIHAPADGGVAPLSAATVENVVGDVTEMGNEMMSAIKLLQAVNEDGQDSLPPKAEEALDYLIHALGRRTKWCNCPPGQCAGNNEAGCRINSPLAK